MPGMRSVRRWSNAATFAEMLSLLVERRVPLDKAVRLAADATSERSLQSEALRMAEEIERGSYGRSIDIDSASAKTGGIPLLVRLALARKSDRRAMSGSLRQAAAMYRERAMRAAEWYAEYVPILLVVGIGGTITAAFTLLVFWPYVGMLHEVAGWNWR
jgi:type II secretory pathway component PulF